MKIAKNTIVSLTYNLRYDDEKGDLIEEITDNNPMDILIGHELLLESFEQKIDNLSQGDTFSFKLEPNEAYGDYDDEKLVRVPKAELLEGLPPEAEEEVFEGNIIPITDADEETYEALIIEIKDDIVSLDFNHPLAGETLYFDGKILNIKQATPKDIEEATKDIEEAQKDIEDATKEL